MPTIAAQDSASFLRTLTDIETAWARLDADAGPDAARDAATIGGLSAQLLLRAAQILDRHGARTEAKALLEQALGLDAPPAPVQFAYAAMLDEAGDRDEARAWLMGAMLRARPDAALAYRLAAIEAERGDRAAAAATVEAAAGLNCNIVDETIAAGHRLRDAGEPRLACRAYARAFARGARDWRFLVDYADLVATAPTLSTLVDDGERLTILATNARLALDGDMAGKLATARQRETSPSWLPREALGAFLAERLAAREPFSWIRLGDGEARFLAFADPAFRSGIDAADADVIGRQLWRAWFGSEIADVAPDRLRTLAEATHRAIARADLLGIPSADRLINDRDQAGYCGLLERHVHALTADGRPRHFTDALFNYTLNEIDPFYQKLLGGRDFVGLIGPHPELAARFGARLGIGEVRSWDIPGENRLNRERDRGDRGLHFPQVHDRLLAELSVPYRGAVFLVAGGLLAKVYCDHIRDLGGIALDIGAVADAWLGYNTRGVVQKISMQAGLI